MPVKLSTTVNNIGTIPNKENQDLVKEFYEFRLIIAIPTPEDAIKTNKNKGDYN